MVENTTQDTETVTIVTLSNEDSIMIDNLTAQDGGVYMCEVSNEAGTGMDMVTVSGELNCMQYIQWSL